MIAFWIAAAALAAVSAALMALRGAAGAARSAVQTEDPAVELYRRQLSEVDDLADRGLLDVEDRRQAFAEAGRRLLAAEAAPEAPAAPGRAARLIVAAAAAVAAACALALYLTLGSPGSADSPFSQRLKAWRAAPPQSLDAPRMAAVLEAMGRQKPNDPQLLGFLGRARLAAGDGFGAVDALRQAARLKPDDIDTLSLLAQAQMSLDPNGAVSAEAEATFSRILALDPADVAARYFLAQAQIARGDTARGLAAWRSLQASFPRGDSRRALLATQIAQVERGLAPGAVPAVDARAQAQAQTGSLPDGAAIQGMVDRLAARLKTSPDDPAGWARLVRAYGVLGQPQAQQRALAQARKLFAARPADLAPIEAEATAKPAGG